MAKKSEAKIKFTAETSDLNKGLSESSKSIRLLTNELKLNATQLKGNSNDINLLKTRQDLLQKELEESRNKVNLTEQAMVKAKKILGENSTEYNKLANDVLKAKNQEAAIKNELDSVNSKLDQQDKVVEKVGDELDNTGDHALTFGEAIKANVIGEFIMSGLTALKNKVVDVAKGMKDAALNAGTFADDLITTSNQTGIGTKELQQLDYAMRFIDVDMDTLTKSMAKNIKQMGAGNENYKKLGISVKDSSGQLRDSQTVFYEVIDALGKIENETERDSISMELFGKSAQELNPLIKAGGDELKKYCKQAEDLGLVVDDKTVTALGAFDDSMQTADATMDAFKTKMGAAVAPAFQDLAEDASEFIQTADFSGIAETAEDFAGAISSATEFVVEHKDGVIALTAGLGAAAVAYGVINVAMPIYTAVSTGAALSTTALGGAIAFLTSPITIAAVAIGALVAGGVALYKNWDTIKSKAKSFGSDVSGKFSKMKTSVVQDFEGMKKEGVEKWEGLKSGAIEKATSLKTKTLSTVRSLKKDAVDGFKGLASDATNSLGKMAQNGVKKFTSLKDGADKMMDGMRSKVKGAVDKVKGYFDFKWKLPDLKLPHPKVTGKFSLNPPQVPKFKLDWYAKGAIFTKPTILNTPSGFKGVAEAGAEGILPVSLIKNYMSDILDEKLSGYLEYFNIDYGRIEDAVSSAMAKIDWQIMWNNREMGRFVRGVQ